jgi:thiosulfate dehydrogenase
VKFVVGVIVGAALVGLVLWSYLWFGMMPIAVNAPSLPLEAHMAHHALHVVSGREAPKQSPIQPDEPNLTAGAKSYVQHCAVCHGLPNHRSQMSKAEYPPPPQLFIEKDMVTDDPPGETYWKVANGIRLTGMPSFSKIMPEQEMWQVSLMLANADKLPPETMQVLNSAQPPTP